MKQMPIKSPTNPFEAGPFKMAIILMFALAAVSASSNALDSIIASARAGNVNQFNKGAGEFLSQRKVIEDQLLEIFQNRQSGNLNKCAAVYYLGELRVSRAADILAQSITLKFDWGHYEVDGLPPFLGYPVVDALVKIGYPSIPATLRNLEESDDAQTRKLSLEVICKIEGDKDIARIRLQKALQAQTNLQKQARLQAALKALDETKL
jgi:hypothetical protein